MSSTTTTCQRCLQVLSSVSRLKSHMERKTPCKIVNLNDHIQNSKFIQPEIIHQKPEEPLIIPESIPKILEKDEKSLVENIPREIEVYEEDEFPVKFSINLQLDKNTGNSTVIFGSSKAGKSTLLMKLYKQYYKDFATVLFTENPQLLMYKDRKLIISPALFGDVIRDMHRINKGTKNKYNMCCLLDDIVDQKENVLVRKLILILRNSNISSIVSLQSTKLLSKTNRGSVNNYIFFKFNTDEMIEEVIRLFLSSYLKGKMDEKIRMYKKMTQNHQFIYYRPRDGKISVHKILC